MIVAKHTCPRRIEDGRADSNSPFVDDGIDKDGWDQRSDQLLWCTYCGSLQPNMFISLMHAGYQLGPTDKNYKVYLANTGGTHVGKFYFQHLDLELKQQFIELYNTKPRPFTIGYPGDFYVLPFFVRREVNSDNDGR